MQQTTSISDFYKKFSDGLKKPKDSLPIAQPSTIRATLQQQVEQSQQSSSWSNGWY